MTLKITPGGGYCPAEGGGGEEHVLIPCSWAVPSWVMPGTVAENARFLAGRAPEVGICLFEAESSAHMPEHELPQELKELPLRWHVHLPTDLPGLSNPALCSEASGRRAAELALGAWRRVAFLHPRFGVLHLPRSGEGGEGVKAASAWLAGFFQVWRDAGEKAENIALENVRGASFRLLEASGESGEAALCLDMAHALAYGQEEDCTRIEILKRVRLIHWSAPGPAASGGRARDRHMPLARLTGVQKDWLLYVWARRALPLLPADVTHVVEVFDWEGILRSLPELEEILAVAREERRD